MIEARCGIKMSVAAVWWEPNEREIAHYANWMFDVLRSRVGKSINHTFAIYAMTIEIPMSLAHAWWKKVNRKFILNQIDFKLSQILAVLIKSTNYDHAVLRKNQLVCCSQLMESFFTGPNKVLLLFSSSCRMRSRYEDINAGAYKSIDLLLMSSLWQFFNANNYTRVKFCNT